jgi:hypothetical protein
MPFISIFAGENTIGLYPLLADETCWFLAVDFDQESWELDAVSFMELCRDMGVPAALESIRVPVKGLMCGYS